MKLLDGLKVIDFTRYFPGPYATLRLSDWGAEVMKIESPDGEPGRFINSHNGEEGSVFRSVNRGKSGVPIDLKSDTGKNHAKVYIEKADVLIEGFRPGVMQRLGLDYESVKQINPSIVYCSLTGYGQSGPYATLSGHDINYMALSGCLDQLKDASGRPVKATIALADLIGGVAASEAILAGLYQRAATGQGCYFDISLTESVFSLMGLHATHESLGYGSAGQMDQSIAYSIYETADGRYVTLGAMEDKFWRAFCGAVGREDLYDHKNSPAVDDNPAYREVQSIIKAKDFAYWSSFFESVDCCFAPVLTIEEALKNPGFTQRGLVDEKWGAAYIATHFLENRPFLQGDEPYPAL